MRRTALLAAGAVVYVLSAWMVAPGFYDGFAPQQPYNWVCPPLHVANNQQPGAFHVDIPVTSGVSEAGSAFDRDGQIVIGFMVGAFSVTPTTKTVSVDVTPISPCPNHPGLVFETNAYEIAASAPLVKSSNLVLRYSDIVPSPSVVYFATDPTGQWKSIGASQQSQAFTIDTTTSELGYFAAGYPANVTPPPGAVTVGGGQLLPIAVAILIIGVVIAGIPLAILRRRQGADEEADLDDDEV